jgi:hypothetical protein
MEGTITDGIVAQQDATAWFQQLVLPTRAFSHLALTARINIDIRHRYDEERLALLPVTWPTVQR